jgi:predicted transcriptional regulator
MGNLLEGVFAFLVGTGLAGFTVFLLQKYLESIDRRIKAMEKEFHAIRTQNLSKEEFGRFVALIEKRFITLRDCLASQDDDDE